MDIRQGGCDIVIDLLLVPSETASHYFTLQNFAVPSPEILLLALPPAPCSLRERVRLQECLVHNNFELSLYQSTLLQHVAQLL